MIVVVQGAESDQQRLHFVQDFARNHSGSSSAKTQLEQNEQILRKRIVQAFICVALSLWELIKPFHKYKTMCSHSVFKKYK